MENLFTIKIVGKLHRLYHFFIINMKIIVLRLQFI